MGQSVQARANEASEIDRAVVRLSEQSFGSIFSDIAKLLWPTLTAPELASAIEQLTGDECSVRAAEMYLGGQRKWSGDAIAAITTEILKRHGMRNVKVLPRA